MAWALVFTVFVASYTIAQFAIRRYLRVSLQRRVRALRREVNNLIQGHNDVLREFRALQASSERTANGPLRQDSAAA